MAKEYDFIIVGGGPGGYCAAIRASQLGYSVAIVEKDKLGGTCLHRGCIPSKSIIRSAEVYAMAKSLDEYGVFCKDVSFDLNKIKTKTDKIVNQMHLGIQSLMKRYKIAVYKIEGKLMGASIFSPLSGSISVVDEKNEEEILIPKNLILATGTSPISINGLPIDGNLVMSSDHVLQLSAVPKSMIIIGGGVIGVEWASLLFNLGVKVTLVEYAPLILPQEDEEVSKEMQNILVKQGINVITNAKVKGETFVKEKGGVSIKVVDNSLANAGQKEVSISAEKILVAVGRAPNTTGIGLENTKIVLDNKGFIEVDENFRTKEKHIFAIGDVTGFMPLAHVATAQGIYVVEYIKGLNPTKLDKNNIPKCVYSLPEVASIGLTEKEAKQSYNIKVAKFPFKVNAKSLIYGESSGFVKIISNKDNNDMLGVHIVGPQATNLISEASLAMFLNASAFEVGKAIHPHPSLSEAIMEAALDIEDQSIHH